MFELFQSVYPIVAATLLWAGISTLIVMVLSIPIAYVLARYQFLGRNVISTIVSLPLVLPPTAIGFVLLRLFADNGFLGRNTLGVDLDLLLNWKGVILACAVMSFPLVVRTARVSFEEVNPRLEKMSLTLGYSCWSTFFKITLPLASRGLIAAGILGFTRAMGEFGATIIVAGNIPGRTQTLASAIYSSQQSGDEATATILLMIALVVGFVAVFATEWLSRPKSENTGKKAVV